MDTDFVFCYSDILYTKQALELLLRDQSDISLVVDTGWRQNYRGRRQHPTSEAELVRIDGDRIAQIGSAIIPVSEAHGEFVGLAKFTKQGAEALKAIYEWAVENYRGRAFHSSPSVDRASFTDLVQELIEQGYPVGHVDIHGGWAEIDTVEDFDRVSKRLQTVLSA
jgi:phosphoenolpyruvate phosphomutase